MVGRGRKRIYTSETDFTSTQKIVDILNYALPIHYENVADMTYLIDYYLGVQPVLQKVKNVRPEINNKIVVNLAQSAVRDVKGYTFGQPVSYVPRTMKNLKELAIFNDANEFENKSSIDNDVAEMMLITGLGYRASFPEQVIDPDEQPFAYANIDPRNTFLIYSTASGNTPVLAVIIEKIIELKDSSLPSCRYRFNVYSKVRKFVFETASMSDILFTGTNPTRLSVENEVVINDPLQILNTLPVQEFRINQWNLGFFESVLDVLNSLNLLASDTLDDIEQKVRSKLILLGVDPQQLDDVEEDEAGNQITFADKMKNSDTLIFTGQQGINQDAKFVTTDVNYQGVDSYREWLESMYYYLLGLPERKTRGNGGGDTGFAVELRDGWASLETVARNIELSWKASERESIKRVLGILRTKKVISDLKTTDIDIKFSRNKLDNIQSKAQAGSTLYSMGIYDPVDITNIMNITTDPQGMVERGKKYQQEKQKELEKQMVNAPQGDNINEGISSEKAKGTENNR